MRAWRRGEFIEYECRKWWFFKKIKRKPLRVGTDGLIQIWCALIALNPKYMDELAKVIGEDVWIFKGNAVLVEKGRVTLRELQ